MKTVERMGAQVPRRICVDLFSPMEKAIADAVRLIEEGPPSVHLTDAVILLGKAREKVADFVDEVPVAVVAAVSGHTAWVIVAYAGDESMPWYFRGDADAGDQSNWSKNHETAMRFSRRQDADVALRFTRDTGQPGRPVVEEHSWAAVSGPARTPSSEDHWAKTVEEIARALGVPESFSGEFESGWDAADVIAAAKRARPQGTATEGPTEADMQMVEKWLDSGGIPTPGSISAIAGTIIREAFATLRASPPSPGVSREDVEALRRRCLLGCAGLEMCECGALPWNDALDALADALFSPAPEKGTT